MLPVELTGMPSAHYPSLVISMCLHEYERVQLQFDENFSRTDFHRDKENEDEAERLSQFITGTLKSTVRIISRSAQR